LIALDTSVVVAVFASWHEAHADAVSRLARRPRLPAHVLIETYSVLTRLPPPHRAASSIVVEFLERNFPAPPLALSGEGHRSLVRLAATGTLTGGSIYDALVAATAKEADALLLTRDRRAAAVYDVVGVRYELTA